MIAACALVGGARSDTTSSNTIFTYDLDDNVHGPLKWPGVCQTGTRQSPINLVVGMRVNPAHPSVLQQYNKTCTGLRAPYTQPLAFGTNYFIIVVELREISTRSICIIIVIIHQKVPFNSTANTITRHCPHTRSSITDTHCRSMSHIFVTPNQQIQKYSFISEFFFAYYCLEVRIRCRHWINQNGPAYTVSGGGLDGTYNLLQLHFHWSPPLIGGEHDTFDVELGQVEVVYVMRSMVSPYMYTDAFGAHQEYRATGCVAYMCSS